MESNLEKWIKREMKFKPKERFEATVRTNLQEYEAVSHQEYEGVSQAKPCLSQGITT
jgi:hypothetical protein